MEQFLPSEQSRRYFRRFMQDEKDRTQTDKLPKEMRRIIWRDTLRTFGLTCHHPIRTYFIESTTDFECEFCADWVCKIKYPKPGEYQ